VKCDQYHYDEYESDQDDQEKDYEKEEEETPKESCSINSFLDSNELSLLLPDDYEEGKNVEPKKSVKHLNETMAIFSRMVDIKKNASAKLEPKMKRIMPQLMDFVYGIDLHPECLGSFIRVASAAQNGELWALKCEINIMIDFIHILNNVD